MPFDSEFDTGPGALVRRAVQWLLKLPASVYMVLALGGLVAAVLLSLEF